MAPNGIRFFVQPDVRVNLDRRVMRRFARLQQQNQASDGEGMIQKRRTTTQTKKRLGMMSVLKPDVGASLEREVERLHAELPERPDT